MAAVPHCLEYYRTPESYDATTVDKGFKKNDENEEKKALEILLVGDDLGICHMYRFTKQEWHYCTYYEDQKNALECHAGVIM